MIIGDNLNMWSQRHGITPQAYAELLDIIDVSRSTTPGNNTSEMAVQAALRIKAASYGTTLWRNNNGAVTDAETNRHVRFGLGNDSSKLQKKWKSSDLIGITPVRAREGQVLGVFTAVEVKKPGWVAPKNERERAQAAFLSTVQAYGGIGMFAQSTQDYERLFSND